MTKVPHIMLKDVASLSSGGTPSKDNPAFWSGSIPWLTPKDMSSYDGSTQDFVTDIAIGNGTRLAPEGTIFVAVRGMSLHNEIRIVRSDRTMAFNQDIKAIIPKGIDGTFLYYALLSKKPNLLAVVESAGHGTGRLPTDKLSETPIPGFTLQEQVAIASLLAAIDDKITANVNINAYLEKMAIATFRDWFIDFGPTRAKMAGQAPYLSPAAWSLFPENLDDMGIPLGWNLVPFESLLDSSLGGDWGDEEAGSENSEAVYVIRGTDLHEISRGGIGKVPLRYTSPKKLDARKLQDMDIVIEVSGGSPTQPTGRSILITSSMLERFNFQAVCASFCRRFRPSSKENAIYAALHLSVLYKSGGTWEYQNQSTDISNLQTTNFLKRELAVQPGVPVLDAFTEMVEPLIRRSSNNEVAFLARLRDELLPKLMSGELQVKDAETMVRKIV